MAARAPTTLAPQTQFLFSGLFSFFQRLSDTSLVRRNSDFEELGLAVGRRFCRSCDMMIPRGRPGARPMKLRRSYPRSTATAKKSDECHQALPRAHFEPYAARGAPPLRKNTLAPP
jgi:hypothetical protein